MDSPNFEHSDYFINRELSLIQFNKRVLQQAADDTVPLLERLRFLCISCTNLDEFFEIRVAGLKQRLELGTGAAGPDKLAPAAVLDAIRKEVVELVKHQYHLLNHVLFPQLDAHGVRFIRRDHWTDAQRDWLYAYFQDQIVPVLTPLTLDPSRPFPKILNKSLNFIVAVKGKDVFGRRRHRALVQAPRSLPRLIQLPRELRSHGSEDYVFLSSIIHSFVEELFPGLQIKGCYQFRVTRNSDLYVDDEEVEDLVGALEGKLAASRYGAAVRLEIAHDCDDELAEFLLNHFALDHGDLFRVEGPVNLNRLLTVWALSEHDELRYAPFAPSVPAAISAHDDIFTAIGAKDILLHHPFQSFTPTIEFIRIAATDPNVLAIKQTLYRSGGDSPIVDHLVAAAKAGKEVTVVIELMARFDEAENIGLASRLQEVGAHVVYGVVGFKTHAKMSLVVRREALGLRRYVHLGTGNYHLRTTREYTDYGLFTADQEIGRDVHRIFMQLTSLTPTKNLKKLWTAPFTLHTQICSLIDDQIKAAEDGRNAHVIAKMNALIDPQIIQKLYRASQAGVQIDLIVRGICSLRPGIPGVSENIRVRSVIGRFLEHSRIYYFRTDDDEEIYLSSADWMDRNFFRRVEICFPVSRKSHRQRLKRDLKLYLSDNTQSWQLAEDGSYKKSVVSEGDPAIAVQPILLERYSDAS